MDPKNVLIFYKRSAYNIYFLDRKSSFPRGGQATLLKELGQFKKAHDEHYKTLEAVESTLRRLKIFYRTAYRGQRVDYARYDFVITVGGDGTFLEAARGVKRCPILGVNSAPSYSVGKLCGADARNFEKIFKKVLTKGFRTGSLQRLRLDINGCRRPVDCLNDVLICHRNPAAMSRYSLKVAGRLEAQCSSGIWIAAPAGSTGAMCSAGGVPMAVHARKMQYKVRELYRTDKKPLHLTGGILTGRRSITVMSLMRSGMVYVDGTHLEFPLPYGAAIRVTISPDPVRAVNI